MQITHESLQKTRFRYRMYRRCQTRVIQHWQRHEILVAQEREGQRTRRFNQSYLLHRARNHIVETILQIILGHYRR